MTQSIYFKQQILEDTRIPILHRNVLAMICDRRKSSVKRSWFFDAELHDFYVIYTRAELSRILGVCENTITNVLNKLKEMNYIKIKYRRNNASKIFLSWKKLGNTKFVFPETQNLCTNHFSKSFQYLRLSVETVDTKQMKFTKGKSASSDNNSKSKNKSNTDKTKQRSKNKVTNEDRIFNEGFKMRKYSMSEDLIWTLKKYSYGKPNLLTKYKNVILTTKSTILKQYTKKDAKTAQIAKDALKFETNMTLSAEILTNIKHMIIESDAPKSKIKNKFAYIGSSMRNIYTQIVEDWLHPEKTNTKIENKVIDGKPTVNVYKNYGTARKPMIESVPEWSNKYTHITMKKDDMNKHIGKMENDPIVKSKRQKSVNDFKTKIEREKRKQKETREQINRQLKKETQAKEGKREKQNKQKEEHNPITFAEYNKKVQQDTDFDDNDINKILDEILKK